jgi:type IV pilus assembly protein PilQ
MRKQIKAVGLLFLAASSVYVGGAFGQNAGSPVKIDTLPTNTPAFPLADATGVTVEPTALPRSGEPAAVAPALPPSPGSTSSADPFAPAPVAVEKPAVKHGDVAYDVDNGTVEIHVNEAPLVEVLRMLSIQSQRNIVASKEVRGTVTANLYGVTVREALDAILHANGYAYREKGNFIYVYTLKEIKEIEQAQRQVSTEVIRLYYTPAANAVTMIKPVLSSDAQVSFTTPADSGIDGGTSDIGGNSHAIEDIIVVTDYPENIEKVRKIIRELDRRPQQILVEATIVRAALTDDNALGVDFNVLAGVNFSDFVFNDGGQISGNTIGDGTSSSSVGSVGTGNNFTNNINGGLRLGFVSDNVSVFLSALEGVTDTAVLANPKVLALNKQRGEVIVGRKDGYYTTTVTESSTVQTVEFLETGTKLYFRPYIGDDGYIRMEIHPEDSSGGLTSSNLPFKITTEVTSNVMVKDGHTIVIGGLFREASDSSRSQVPVLGNIPLAGTLFRQQRDRTQREEVIILLTPHIIKNDVAYAQLSEEQLRNAEMLRVGVRQGMMISGRERMAESCYRSALEELGKPDGDRARAIWYLNCATNLHPKFLEAIKLRQELTGEQIAAVDNSSIRGFVREAMLRDVAAVEPTTAPAAPAAPAAPLTPTSSVAAGPTTQPAIASTESPTTQPKTELSLVDDSGNANPGGSGDQQVVADRPRTVFGWMRGWFATRPAPTEPKVATGGSRKPKVVVTEIPDATATAGVDSGK